jgi:MFS family permease
MACSISGLRAGAEASHSSLVFIVAMASSCGLPLPCVALAPEVTSPEGSDAHPVLRSVWSIRAVWLGSTVTADVSGQGRQKPARLLTPEFVALTTMSSLYFAGTGVLNALMPIFVVDDIGGTEATAGFVMGVLALTSLVSRPFFGRIADRFGARRILIIGALVSALSMVVLLVFPPSVPTAIASRLILGTGGAALFTGSAMRSLELAPAGRQAQATSFILVSIHVGLGLGPVVGLRILDRFGFQQVWGTVAVLSLLSCCVALLLTATPQTTDRAPGALISRSALLPGVVTLFGVFAFNGFMTFASLYGREVGVADVGFIFMVLSGTIVAVRLVAGGVPDRVGPIVAGAGALVVTIAAALLVAFWATPTGLFVGAVMLAFGLSLQSPSFIPLAVAGVADHERGAAMATFTGFYDIANALVGPVLGLIVAGAGYRAAFSFTAVMAAVALVILGTVLAPRWRSSEFAA